MLLFRSIGLAILLGGMVGLLSAEPEKTRVTPLSGKCLAVGRDQLAQRSRKVTRPVVNVCMAAAIADRAFRRHTHNSEPYYEVFEMPGEARWHFHIEFGNAVHPPRPGGHCMVTVNPATGRTEYTPGI
jgi:hypothetical protein